MYKRQAQALADKFIVFRDDYGAVSRLLLELIRAEALTRGYHIITCPCAIDVYKRQDPGRSASRDLSGSLAKDSALCGAFSR